MIQLPLSVMMIATIDKLARTTWGGKRPGKNNDDASGLVFGGGA